MQAHAGQTLMNESARQFSSSDHAFALTSGKFFAGQYAFAVLNLPLRP
jgi:hypothetical protein